MRRFLPILVAVLGAAGCASLGDGAVTRGQSTADQGHAFVRRAGAGCHAVEPTGDSPNPDAPPFRTLSSRLPGKTLDEQLARLSARGHVEMPPIYMTPEEQRGIAAYIRSLGVVAAARQSPT